MRIVFTLAIILLGTWAGMAQVKETKSKKVPTEPAIQAPKSTPEPAVSSGVQLQQPLPVSNAINKKDVPAAVVGSYLSQNSSGATDSVWTKENITIYKVSYSDNGQHYEAQYFGDGRWIKTYTQVDQLSLPVSVTNRIKELYPSHDIAKAYIELNNDGKFYAADLYKGSDRLTVYFTMGGKFVK